MSTRTHPALRSFHILQELSGERGNETFLARGQSGNVVAIKILASGPISDEQSSALAREASLGARLGHEAILQPRALIVEKDLAAVVTEFVPGVSLQRLLRFAAGRGVRLPDVCAWYILERVLAALAAAHAAGKGAEPILHRGISASSVVVGWDGTVKIGDFGLVRMRQIVSGGIPPSKSERDVAPLMSPEETRGDRPDTRSDVFCAALLAVRLATGRTPYARFRSSPSEMILAMSEGAVAHLAQTRPDLAAPLRVVFDAALERDRAKRTITAEQLLAAVRENIDIARGKSALARLMSRWRELLEATVTPWERRASIPPEAAAEEQGLMKAGTLALATPDERPSDGALVTDQQPEEPWNKGVVPAEEKALAPTDPDESLSRVGSTAPDALSMPLPELRMTIPSLPVYGGEPVKSQDAARPLSARKGRPAAAMIAMLFVVLVFGALVLFRWLMRG